MKRLILAGLGLFGVATAAFALGPADTIRMRQANYKQMAAAMKGINDQLRGGSPSNSEIRRNSALIVRHSLQVLNWFPRGTGPESGVRTRAKPEIWSDRRGFTRAGARLLVAARQLDRAARGGDIAQVRAAVPPVQRACGGCHEAYRGPER